MKKKKFHVKCSNITEWDKVRGSKLGSYYNKGRGIYIDGDIYTHGMSDNVESGIKIITAEEYLQEGVESMEFKVGDEVVILVNSDERGNTSQLNRGDTFIISDMGERSGVFLGHYWCAGSLGGKVISKYLKLVSINKETLTKENTMHKILSDVLRNAKVSEGELVAKHERKIIGGMEDTAVNRHQVRLIGAKGLISMANQCEEDEVEAAKKDK